MNQCTLKSIFERFAAPKRMVDYVEFWSWTDKDLKAVRKAAEAAEIGIRALMVMQNYL